MTDAVDEILAQLDRLEWKADVQSRVLQDVLSLWPGDREKLAGFIKDSYATVEDFQRSKNPERWEAIAHDMRCEYDDYLAALSKK